MSVAPVGAVAHAYFSLIENSAGAIGSSHGATVSSAHHTSLNAENGGLAASAGGFGNVKADLRDLLSGAGGFGNLGSGSLSEAQAGLLASAGGYATQAPGDLQISGGDFTAEQFPAYRKQKKWYEMISDDAAPKWYELLEKIPLPKWYEMTRSESPAWYQTILSQA